MSNVSCTVAWTDGAFYGLRIDRYRIEGRTDHNDTWRVLADRVVAEQIDFQVNLPSILVSHWSILAILFSHWSILIILASY